MRVIPQPSTMLGPSRLLRDAGLIDMCMPGVAGGVTLNGVVPTRYSGWTDEPLEHGIARVTTDALQADTWAGIYTGLPAPITLVAWFRYKALSATKRVLGAWRNATDGWMFSPTGTTSRALAVYGSSNIQATKPAATTTAAGWHAMRATNAAGDSNVEYLIDGRSVDITGSASTFRPATIDLSLGRQGADGQNAAPVEMYWWGLFGGYVPSDVLLRLERERWGAIFAPQSRARRRDEGAGATVPTLSSLTTTNITATTATLGLTLTF